MAVNWNLLRRKYTALPEDPTHDQVKAAIRDYYGQQSPKALADARQERGDQLDRHAQIVSCVNAEVTILDELLIEHLDKLDATSITTSSGVTFKKDSTLDAKVYDHELLRAWLVERNMHEMLKVNGNTLSKLVRDRDDKGEGPPPGVDAIPRNKLRVK